MSGSYIYFVGAQPDGPIKIGYSTEPGFRRQYLGVACPWPLELLAQVEGSRAIEKVLHRHFKASRTHGEWFSRSPELLALIASLKAGGVWPEYVREIPSVDAAPAVALVRQEKPRVRLFKVAPPKAGNWNRNPNTEAICAAVLAGQHYSEIAEQYGVSRERIRQIANRNGLHGARSHAVTCNSHDRALAAREANREAKRERDRRVLELIKVKSATRVGAELGIAHATVLTICHQNGVFPTREGRKHKQFNYDDREIKRLRDLGLNWADIAKEIGAPSGMSLTARYKYRPIEQRIAEQTQ